MLSRLLLIAAIMGFGAASSLTPPPLLDESNFVETMRSGHARWFVFFYSPHCGHCSAMKPAWDELADNLRTLKSIEDVLDRRLPDPRPAAVDAAANRALADKLGVNGYPTLLAFEPGGAVYEYDGDRSTNSMFEFATREKFPMADAKARRGYLDPATGVVLPSTLDLWLRAPADMTQIVEQAAETSRVASMLLAAFWLVAGMCAAVLFGYSPFAQRAEPQFLVVERPAGVLPGESFNVELVRSTRDGGGSGRRLPLQGLFLWRRERKLASRILQVKAPPGIAPGQTFFVPLVAPPTVRVGSPAAAEAAAAPPSKPKVS